MATTTRNKHKQLAKEVERQRLVQEEGDDTDSDYKSNLSESEQEASDQTISDNDVVDVINITDDNDANTSIIEDILKKRKPPNKITRPKTSW
ncbi:12971_t:CDS:1, partial [Funneliformis geosporum]